MQSGVGNNNWTGDSNNGVLLVQRYTGMEINAHAALCNAVQEPGFVGFFTSMRRDRKEFLHSEEVRMPHIYDVMRALSNQIAVGTPPPNIKDEDLCVFLGGFPFEAETFTKLKPKIFFITVIMNEIKVNFPKWGVSSQAEFVVPVILRGGYYYIIIGKDDLPVYRVHHPIEFFFSADGKSLLLTLLGQCNENCTIEMLCTNVGRQILYFFPHFKINDGWPNNQWDWLTADKIRKKIQPYHLLVDEQEQVPNHSSDSYVQLVRLDDKENVVDILFPLKESVDSSKRQRIDDVTSGDVTESESDT